MVRRTGCDSRVEVTAMRKMAMVGTKGKDLIWEGRDHMTVFGNTKMW